jgi:hypothetical protein
VGLCLHSWRQERRVVVLRRQLASPPELDDYGQAQLPELNLELGGIWYEHAGLDGIFDGGLEAKPVDGAYCGADFQLVEVVFADDAEARKWRGRPGMRVRTS